MTQQFPSDSLTSGTAVPVPAADEASDGPGTVDIAKDQAASRGQGAAEAGQHVAAVAKDQTQNVLAEAGTQAKDLLRQARSELSEQAGAQQQRLARGLHALADELHSMTRHSEQPGVATDLARQGASRSHDVARWLETREPGNLLEELRTFARRRPGAFLVAAAGAGLVAGRLTRGVKDATSNDEPAGPSAGQPPVQSRPVAAATPPADLALGVDSPPAHWGGLGEYGGSPAEPDFPLLGQDR
jgi:hypothetical protein